MPGDAALHQPRARRHHPDEGSVRGLSVGPWYRCCRAATRIECSLNGRWRRIWGEAMPVAWKRSPQEDSQRRAHARLRACIICAARPCPCWPRPPDTTGCSSIPSTARSPRRRYRKSAWRRCPPAWRPSCASAPARWTRARGRSTTARSGIVVPHVDTVEQARAPGRCLPLPSDGPSQHRRAAGPVRLSAAAGARGAEDAERRDPA